MCLFVYFSPDNCRGQRVLFYCKTLRDVEITVDRLALAWSELLHCALESVRRYIIHNYTKYSMDYQNRIALQVIVTLIRRRNAMFKYLTKDNEYFQKLNV